MAGVRVTWPDDSDPDKAHEIGGAPRRRPASMTRVNRDPAADGGLVFEVDLPLVSFGPAERRVRYQPSPTDQGSSSRNRWRDVRWYRLEAKVDRPIHHAGWRLVIAEHPYANGHVTWLSIFKPERSDNAGRRPNPLQLDTMFADDEKLFEWLDHRSSLERDLWESRPRFTAGVSRPDPSWFPGKELRNYGANALFVLGTCDDPDECVRSLLASDRSARLLDATRRNRLHFWHPETETNTADGELRLCPEVQGRANEILELSARQSLAGPHDEDPAKIARWIGCPVVEKLDHIYCNHMNNLNRAARSAG